MAVPAESSKFATGLAQNSAPNSSSGTTILDGFRGPSRTDELERNDRGAAGAAARCTAGRRWCAGTPCRATCSPAAPAPLGPAPRTPAAWPPRPRRSTQLVNSSRLRMPCARLAGRSATPRCTAGPGVRPRRPGTPRRPSPCARRGRRRCGPCPRLPEGSHPADPSHDHRKGAPSQEAELPEACVGYLFSSNPAAGARRSPLTGQWTCCSPGTSGRKSWRPGPGCHGPWRPTRGCRPPPGRA